MVPPINSEEFMKQRRKLQDLERFTRELKQELDKLTVDKVVKFCLYISWGVPAM